MACDKFSRGAGPWVNGVLSHRTDVRAQQGPVYREECVCLGRKGEDRINLFRDLFKVPLGVCASAPVGLIASRITPQGDC